MSLSSSGPRHRGLEAFPPPRRLTPFLAVLAALDLGIWTYVGHAVAFPGGLGTRSAAIALETGQP
jgi:hypothetical protein